MPLASALELGRKPRRRTGPSVLRLERQDAASLTKEVQSETVGHLSLPKGGPDRPIGIHPAIRI